MTLKTFSLNDVIIYCLLTVFRKYSALFVIHTT